MNPSTRKQHQNKSLFLVKSKHKQRASNPKNPTMEASTDSTTPATEKKKGTKRSGKSRPPARPYKRLELSALKLKIETFKKQKALKESQLCILNDKLEKHENEMTKREEEEEAGSE